MPPPRRPKGSAKVPGSGRKKGTRNRTTAEIQACFRKHAPALVKGLLELAESADEKVRIAAIRESLDRGFGKPAQALATEPDAPLEIRVSIVHQVACGQ